MGTAFLYLWMMAFVRAGGVITMIPVFSGRNIPMPVRIALAALLALIGLQSVREITTPPDDVFTLVLATAHELIIGLLMGLGVRLIFLPWRQPGRSSRRKWASRSVRKSIPSRRAIRPRSASR